MAGGIPAVALLLQAALAVRLVRLVPLHPPVGAAADGRRNSSSSSSSPSPFPSSSSPSSSSPRSSLDALEPSLRGLVEGEMQDLGFGPEIWAGGPSLARRSRRRKPLLWIHIHKAAGSTICGLAHCHGERPISPSSNCNWRGHDNSCDPGHVPCEERIAEFEKQGATWGAIERVVTPDDICPQFFSYGVLLRDPNELALSAFDYHKMDSKVAVENLECVAHNQSCDKGAYEGWARGCDHVRDQKSWYGQPLWWWFDNIVVRTLGGEEVRSLPARGIKKEHYRRALAVATRMEVVILLDEIRASTAVLEQAFGWKLPNNTPKQNPATKRRTDLTESQLRLAKRTNKWDYKLYNHFKKMPLSSRLRPLE